MYPPAPWALQGSALQTLHLLDIERVRSSIPSPFEILSVLPGKTLGGLYLAKYGAGSTLEYNELIVVSALVKQEQRLGAWISHIYVDNGDSVAGGREIWGLPKEKAEFEWETGTPNRAIVRQGNRGLCALEYRYGFSTWNQRLSVPCFGQQADRFLVFWGKVQFRLGFANVRLTVPPESPFASFNLERNHWLSLDCQNLQLVAEVPESLATVQGVAGAGTESVGAEGPGSAGVGTERRTGAEG